MMSIARKGWTWFEWEGDRPKEGLCLVELEDGTVHEAWYNVRKDLFTTPDGGEGFDPVRFKEL